jgi:hypothetical protein
MSQPLIIVERPYTRDELITLANQAAALQVYARRAKARDGFLDLCDSDGNIQDWDGYWFEKAYLIGVDPEHEARLNGLSRPTHHG